MPGEITTAMEMLITATREDVGAMRLELAKKADKDDVREIVQRLEKHDARLNSLERSRVATEATRDALLAAGQRSYSKIEKAAGLIVGLLTLVALFFGPAISQALFNIR